MRAQLGPLSYEVEIGPNLVWRRHTDQIKDSNVPVADNRTAVINPLLFPPSVECHGDQVDELPEQTEAVPRETRFQPSNPAVRPSVSSPPSQIEHLPVRRYPTRGRKPPARLDLRTLNCHFWGSDFIFKNSMS